MTSSLTNHQKCYLRDKTLLSLLQKCQVLDTDQIKILFFPDVSLRMAQGRLKKLVQRKVIKRDRLSFDQPYYYYVDKKPGQIEHKLAVNWVYVWFVRAKVKKGWEVFHSFEWEVPYGKILRPDGFAAIRNLAYNKLTFYFIEMDIADSRNGFDKVAKYNQLYKSGEFMNYWWAPHATGFPSIIVVTTSEKKKKAILDIVSRENKYDLEFQVFTLDQIKEECTHGRSC